MAADQASVTIKRVRATVHMCSDAASNPPSAGTAAAWLIGHRPQRGTAWNWAKKAGDMPPIGTEERTAWKNRWLAVIAVPRELKDGTLDQLVEVLAPETMR